MRETVAPLLFKAALNNSLREALEVAAPAGLSANRMRWELSSNPDFGDYFTTALLALDHDELTIQSVAQTVATKVANCAGVLRAEATGSGFVNIFVSLSTAAQALKGLEEWINSNVPSNWLITPDAQKIHRHCPDTKLRFAYSVWQIIASRSSDVAAGIRVLAEDSALALLCDPDEFAVILQLHEFPERLSDGMSSGYLYRLAVLIRDGFFWHHQLAPFWINDWEEPRVGQPRKYLLSLCERVMRIGINVILEKGITSHGRTNGSVD